MVSIYGRQRKAEFWQKIRNDKNFISLIDTIKEVYIKYRESALDPLPASSYNLYWVTGNRKNYESEYFAHRSLLVSSFILALIYPENSEYLDKYKASVSSICDEFNWVVPAHSDTHKIDLFSAETGLLLAESISFLEDRIDDSFVHSVKSEIYKRIIEVYENNEFLWEKYASNWTSVCTGCIATTMMYAFQESLYKNLERIKKACTVYFEGFSDEGICLEGPDYWAYGFGNFLYMADALYIFTEGNVNLFTYNKAKNVALYPRIAVLCGRAATSFSDSSRVAVFSKGLINCINSHYDNEIRLPNKCLTYKLPTGNYQNAVLRNFIFDDTNANTETKITGDYFLPSANQMIYNRKGFSLFIKAGNNEELHNHNDVGSFIFADSDGQVLCDLGAGMYSKEYFGKKRYDILCTSSLGHNLPIINGQPQQAGKNFCGNIKVDGNIATVDYKDAYNIELINLLRTVNVFEKGIVLVDEFEGNIETFTSRLVTLREPMIAENRISLGKTDIIFNDDLELKIEKAIHTNNLSKEETVWLMDFKVKNIIKGKCELKIELAE